jgi:lysyl-tRNA synthetase class 2
MKGVTRHETDVDRSWWRRGRSGIPQVVAVLVGLYGLASILRAITPMGRRHLRWIVDSGIPLPASATAAAVTAAAGVLLVLLAHGLWRRKRRAWRAALGVCLLIAFTHLLSHLGLATAVVAILLAGLLLVAEQQFYALGDPTTRWLAVRAVVVTLGLGWVAGVMILTLYAHRLVGGDSWIAKIWTVMLGLIGVSGPLRFESDRVDLVFSSVLASFGILAAVVGGYLALRPQEPRPRLERNDAEDLRDLLAKFGRRDSLGYFALREDKSLVWAPSRKAAVSYRVVAGVALASGDPLGDPEAWPHAVRPFLELCRQHAWTPAVMGCSEQGGILYQRNGLSVLEIGDEAVVEVEEFSLMGRPMRNVRQAVQRVARAGYSANIRRLRDISPDEITEIARAANLWREGSTERGFSMALGRFGDERDGDCVVVTASQDGALKALLNFVPWGPDGLSLDLMRRDRSAENGLNDFLIASLLGACGEMGVARVSLNFAAFRAAIARGERLGAGPLAKGWSRLLIFASRWWQIDTLYRFNAKFGPTWVPRYVCYPTSLSLGQIGLAVMEAEAFWRRPQPFRALARRPLEPAPQLPS